MPTWHQLKAGIPKLSHPTLWSSYNPHGHLCIVRHESREACLAYCERTGNVPLMPDRLTITERAERILGANNG